VSAAQLPPSPACIHTAGYCWTCHQARNAGAVAALTLARGLVADDGLAMSSLTLGAYRTQLLQSFRQLLLEAGAPDFLVEPGPVDP
jgi:hypothetical protein